MLRTLLATLGASALLATVANAADLPRSHQPATGYIVPGFNWSGFYVGALAGYSTGTQKFNQIGAAGVTAVVPTGPADTDISGGSFGGLIGFNNQIGNVVWGLEADLSWAQIKGSQTLPSVGPLSTLATTQTSYGTARGRLGYAFDRVLPYLTGGLYWASSEANTDLVRAAADTQFKTKTDDLGWTLGGGVEFALDRNWSVKAEYLYAKADLKYNLANNGQGLNGVAETAMHQNIVRGGVNYRF